MSGALRMMASISAGLVVILATFFMFWNTSYDDQRSSALRQIAETNLNRKAVRELPSNQNSESQRTLAHFSIKKLSETKKDWSTDLQPYSYEEAVWEQLYDRFGNKIQANVSEKENLPEKIGEYNTSSRKITWSYKGKAVGTLIFSYLHGSSLQDIKAVKVQAMISGRDYSTNIAVVHDSNNNNFGNYSGAPILATPTNIVDAQDRKSGASISKSYTTDTGYNVVWDTNFVQPLKYGMDHIVLKYTFDQSQQKVILPDSLKKIYQTASKDALPVKIIQSSDGHEPFQLDPSQVKIDNNIGEITVTLTKDQSLMFFNLDYNNNHQMLFRVYTMLANAPITHDYAAASAQLQTIGSDGKILNTQRSDTTKIRITPFAVQPIDANSKTATAIQTLTHYANRMYGDDDDKKLNNDLSSAQHSFAKSSNSLNK